MKRKPKASATPLDAMLAAEMLHLAKRCMDAENRLGRILALVGALQHRCTTSDDVVSKFTGDVTPALASIRKLATLDLEARKFQRTPRKAKKKAKARK